MTRRDDEALTPAQKAALKEFDRAVNGASEAEVLGLIVPAVLGPRYGGALRLRGCSRRQLRALMDLKKRTSHVAARLPVAAHRHQPTRVPALRGWRASWEK